MFCFWGARRSYFAICYFVFCTFNVTYADMKKADSTRGKNFLESERILLIKLCNKYKHIIECKKSDMNFLRDKEAAWHQITRQFNAVFVGAAARTTKQLQEKYKNIKKDLRKQHADCKKYASGTGGGPYIPPPDTKTEEEKELFETIRLSADGLSNEFDTDGRYGITGAPSHIINIDRTNVEASETISVPDDWTSGSSILWRTPKNPKLLGKQPEKSRSFTDQETPSSFLDSENVEPEQKSHALRKQSEKINNYLSRTFTEQEAPSSFPDSENVDQEQESHALSNDDGENNAIENDMLKDPNENTSTHSSRYVRPTNRRRPIIKKKKMTVTSAGKQFELAAQKKISLIEQELLVVKTKFKQIQEEHTIKMEILKVRKDNEIIKNKILKEGTMVFEF